MNNELLRNIYLKSTLLGKSAPEAKEAHDMLAGKSGRDANDALFICEGLWAAEKLLARKLRIVSVYYNSEYFSPSIGRCTESELKRLGLLADAAEHVYAVSSKVCAYISDRDGADVCFIVAEMPAARLEDIELADNMLAIVLDGQEQPGNVGTILRSLDAAGGSFAVMTNRRVRLTHPRLIRASLGSAFMLPVPELPIEALIDWLTANSFRIVLTDLQATQNFCDIPAGGRVAVVAGNEHSGISPIWRTLPQAEPVIIPMLGSVESLNVGFASTLVAYNIGLRQKGLM